MGDKKDIGKGLLNPMAALSYAGSGIKKLDPGRPARQATRQAAEAALQTEETMDRQRMQEEARIADEEDRIKRKRYLSQGGRRSLLIAPNPMGTSSELGGGGMYG
jgi:hypothetical protein